MKMCCPACFGDIHLASLILERATDSGQCSFCKEHDAPLLDPIKLRDEFELVAGIYISPTSYDADDGRKTLGEWLQEDWLLFPKFDQAQTKELLSEIFDDGNLPRQTFVPSPKCVSQSLSTWELLRKELMEENRFFPKTAIDPETIANLISQLIFRGTLPAQWYRARIQESDASYPIVEMGAPPKLKASHGRANPVGIPYLYMASTVQTAASEIRPHTGEKISVATFTINQDVKLVDLRNPRKLISPFIYSEESEVASLRADSSFLERLGDELTRPVLPRSAAIDYIPSQYLCELIKNLDYDGVIYRSSMSGEINIALFYPAKASPCHVESILIDEVRVIIR